ncbi:hypothetical protein FACS1894166_06160 [Bacilli bacterium]|nr:hypothetical protein FACS1894166_06160 [Bacilli bacterium]
MKSKSNLLDKELVNLAPSPIQTAPAKKKIGFVSAVLLVIGSSIGSGIFIKNHEMLNNVHGAIFYVILA